MTINQGHSTSLGTTLPYKLISSNRRTWNKLLVRHTGTALQGRGDYFEVGGGGQTSPGVQGNPNPKLKTPRIWPTVFGRDPSSRAKTNTNKNERHLQFKVWVTLPKVPSWGASCPHCPARFPRPCRIVCTSFCMGIFATSLNVVHTN